MPEKKKNRFLLYVLLTVFATGFLFVIFNEYGFIKYLKLKSQVNETKNQIEEVNKMNLMLEAEIDSLVRKDPAKIERTAREKHKMIKKGEQTIKIEEE